jgi:hypothetical protein
MDTEKLDSSATGFAFQGFFRNYIASAMEGRAKLLPYRNANPHRSQTEEKRIHSVLHVFKFHFVPSRFLNGSRAWKFRERFAS